MTIEEKADNYMRGRAMALSFKPLTLEDVKEAYIIGAEEQKHIDDAQLKEYLDNKILSLKEEIEELRTKHNPNNPRVLDGITNRELHIAYIGLIIIELFGGE